MGRSGPVLAAFVALLQLSVAFISPSRSSPFQVQRSSVLSRGVWSCYRGSNLSSASTTLSTVAMSTDAVALHDAPQQQDTAPMSNLAKTATKMAAIAFIMTVALGLISSLSFIKLLGYLGVGTETRRQKWALSTGQFVTRWALRLIPFCKVDVIVDEDAEYMKHPEPAIWVCNHMSMLDVFLLLASDRKLRGNKKRPIKVVYWKQLEENPFSRILFRQSGFIPIDMVANKPGEDNEYDKKSFKNFLKESKQAFVDGFDIGVLPEGQLNPAPEKGLLPLFSGAFTLARMSKRPIQMIALHGINKLWHPNDGFGVGDMNVTGRHVKIRAYPNPRKYESDEDFKATFTAVVGHFGKYGTDTQDLESWLDGSKWREVEMTKRKEEEEARILKKEMAEERWRRTLLERRMADERKALETKLQQQQK